ncbi:MAG: hypothetical protein HY078_12900 [Elusimicrobia bacterium]|nr:hypothetical protein [Elusimicrobiota bacterium]
MKLVAMSVAAIMAVPCGAIPGSRPVSGFGEEAVIADLTPVSVERRLQGERYNARESAISEGIRMLQSSFASFAENRNGESHHFARLTENAMSRLEGYVADERVSAEIMRVYGELEKPELARYGWSPTLQAKAIALLGPGFVASNESWRQQVAKKIGDTSVAGRVARRTLSNTALTDPTTKADFLKALESGRLRENDRRDIVETLAPLLDRSPFDPDVKAAFKRELSRFSHRTQYDESLHYQRSLETALAKPGPNCSDEELNGMLVRTPHGNDLVERMADCQAKN